jgi:D-alanine transaminase
VTLPDNRWERVDIKSTGLLPNVLAKRHAKESGAFETWFVDGEGFVTEGSSTNAWIVNRDGVLLTRPAEHGILRGITRTVVLEAAAGEGLTVEERAFTLDEAFEASEAFLTASSTVLMPVVRIDDRPIADGTPGPLATHLRAIFHRYATSSRVWSTPDVATGDD